MKEKTATEKHDDIVKYIFENPIKVLRKITKTDLDFFNIKMEIEKPVLKKNYGKTDIVGYIDLSIDFKYKFNNGIQYDRFYIEVKSYIKSFGELLRQINTYKTYEKYGKYVVVSPDDRFVELIESQDIKFLKYV